MMDRMHYALGSCGCKKKFSCR